MAVHRLFGVPAGEDLAFRCGEHRRGQGGGIGLEEVVHQRGAVAVDEGQPDLAHRLGHILVGHAVALPGAVGLAEEQGHIQLVVTGVAVLQCHVHGDVTTGGEELIGILAVVRDGLGGKPVAVVLVHPQLAADLQDVLVGIGRGIVVFGKRSSCAGGIDHEFTVGFQGSGDGGLLLLGDGIGLGLLHEHALLLVIGNRHIRTGLVLDSDSGLHHESRDAEDIGLCAGGTHRQVVRGRGRGDLDDEAVVQGHAVDKGGVAVYDLDQVAVGPVEEELHLAKLPVGDVGDLILLALQGEGGNALIPQLDEVLLVAGQARGGLHIGQGRGPNLFRHVGHKGILALIGRILDTGQVVEVPPIRVGEELVKDLLALHRRLGRLVFHQPVIQPVEAQEHAHGENGNEHKIEGVEDDAAQAGTPLLRLGRSSGPLHIGIRGLLGTAALRAALGASGILPGLLAVRILSLPVGILLALLTVGILPGLLGTGLGDLLPGRFRRALVGLVDPLLGLGLGLLGDRRPVGAVFRFKLSLIHSARPPYLTIQKSGILLGSDCSTE